MYTSLREISSLNPTQRQNKMKYDAFISYRHSELDMYIAKKLHKGLETFKVPRAVAKKTGKKKIKRVFRDQEELPIGSDLGDNISAALSESEYLVAICSPRTPQSEWVKKEISTFIQMHDRSHALAILIEGEPDESFPEELLKDENGNPVEPLAADVRGKTRHEMNKKFKTEIMRLAAPILGCSYDDLRQRHRERRLKKAIACVAIAGAIIAGLGISFGLYNARMASEIRENFQEKQKNQSKYLADISLDLLDSGDREAAVLVALSALPGEDNDRPYTPEAEYALSNALYTYETGNYMKGDRLLHHDLPVSLMNYSEDGTYLTVTDTYDNVYVWDVSNGTLIQKIKPSFSSGSFINHVQFANVMDKDKLVVCDSEKLCVYNLQGEVLFEEVHESTVNACVENGPTNEVITEAIDQLTLYDIAGLKKVKAFTRPKGDLNFSRSIVFDKDSSYIAVSRYSSESDVGTVSIINKATGEETRVETAKDSIIKLCFTEDKDLIVYSGDSNDMIGVGEDVFTNEIEMFALDGGSAKWAYEVQVPKMAVLTSSTNMKTIRYKDSSGDGYTDQLTLTSGTNIISLNAKTGEEISKISVSSDIYSLYLSKESNLAIVAQGNGVVDVVNIQTGYIYSTNAIDTKKDLSAMVMKNGIMCVYSYQNPDVLVLKYHEGKGMVSLGSFDDSISNVHVSDDESYFMVRSGFGSENTTYNFFNADTNELIDKVPCPEESYEVYAGFINDEEFLFVGNHTDAFVYNVTTKTKEDFTSKDVPEFEDGYVSSMKLSANKEYAVMYWGRDYFVANIKERRVIRYFQGGETFSGILASYITNDGKRLYILDQNGKGLLLDAETNSVISELPEEFKILNGSDSELYLIASPDEKYLAVCCRDDCVRVYDTETGEIVEKIPMVARSSPFMKFSHDNTRLYMQGDDHYFKIYNFADKTFEFISSEQINDVSILRESEDKSLISIAAAVEMYIISLEYDSMIRWIPGGEAFLSKKGKILSSFYSDLYLFPYATLEDLKANVEEQFPGASLTEDQKVKYHVE